MKKIKELKQRLNKLRRKQRKPRPLPRKSKRRPQKLKKMLLLTSKSPRLRLRRKKLRQKHSKRSKRKPLKKPRMRGKRRPLQPELPQRRLTNSILLPERKEMKKWPPSIKQSLRPRKLHLRNCSRMFGLLEPLALPRSLCLFQDTSKLSTSSTPGSKTLWLQR
jgi:hypothetical protein